MRFVIKIILISIITLIISPYYPFWLVASFALVINIFVKTNGLSSFLSGFLGIGITWSVYAWILSNGEGEIINQKVSQILSLSPGIMFLISGLLGGITGGFASWAGKTIGDLLFKKTINPYS